MRNRVLVYAEALDVAAEGAIWYARQIGDGDFKAVHVAGPRTDSGIHARWFDFTGGEPRLDVRPAGSDAIQVVLGEIAKLRSGSDDTVVTVVLPEQFSKRSLLAAAQRAQFRLKLRLLVEPGVVVADVPAITSVKRPEGHVPAKLHVRVLAGRLDEATERAIEYARGFGNGADVRALHFGERDWDAAAAGIPVEDAPREAKLGDSILTYVRELSAGADVAVNVVLPERLHPNLPRLRGRRALAIKKCLLFEPHVILSSIPFQA